MYHPSRGGVRGGTDQFSWESVKTDKHRENYLGHSVMAPVGRWQKGKDLSWYAKERKGEESVEKTRKSEEMAAIKKAEEEAMLIALGFKPAQKTEQAIDKEEMTEILKRGQNDRGDGNIERIQGVGTESGRAAMLLISEKQKKNSKGIVFESRGNEKSKSGGDFGKDEEIVSEVADRTTSSKYSKKSTKKKKHKKHKKKHKRHISDSEADSDTDTRSSSKHKRSLNDRSPESPKHKKSKKFHQRYSPQSSPHSLDIKKQRDVKHGQYDEHNDISERYSKSLSRSSQRKYRHDPSSEDDACTSDFVSSKRHERKK